MTLFTNRIIDIRGCRCRGPQQLRGCRHIKVGIMTDCAGHQAGGDQITTGVEAAGGILGTGRRHGRLGTAPKV